MNKIFYLGALLFLMACTGGGGSGGGKSDGEFGKGIPNDQLPTLTPEQKESFLNLVAAVDRARFARQRLSSPGNPSRDPKENEMYDYLKGKCRAEITNGSVQGKSVRDEKVENEGCAITFHGHREANDQTAKESEEYIVNDVKYAEKNDVIGYVYDSEEKISGSNSKAQGTGGIWSNLHGTPKFFKFSNVEGDVPKSTLKKVYGIGIHMGFGVAQLKFISASTNGKTTLEIEVNGQPLNPKELTR